MDLTQFYVLFVDRKPVVKHDGQYHIDVADVRARQYFVDLLVMIVYNEIRFAVVGFCLF
jgi:hypothetical protein